MDVYLSTVSNRLNSVMKQLTMIATIFLPLSWLTGFFGQNFGFEVGHIARLGELLVSAWAPSSSASPRCSSTSDAAAGSESDRRSSTEPLRRRNLTRLPIRCARRRSSRAGRPRPAVAVVIATAAAARARQSCRATGRVRVSLVGVADLDRPRSPLLICRSPGIDPRRRLEQMGHRRTRRPGAARRREHRATPCCWSR